MNEPHGGKLINQILSQKERDEILQNQDSYEILTADDEIIKDAKNVARGLYSPLTGFLRENDFNSVVADMRLQSGLIWSIPIVLDISEKDKIRLNRQKEILLANRYGRIVALVKDIEIYSYDKNQFAQEVFGTDDKAHFGVAEVFKAGDYLLGGDIWLVDDNEENFRDYLLTPAQTRKIFQERGWQTIVAFQTRNVPHRGHEFLQREALKQADGLFVQPVIGRKKVGDFKDELIVATYELLIDKYYPKGKVLLGVLPVKMRYAGPREAVFHALVRKNFGCTHFIVGRDHAGVGKYYPPFAAHEIFNKFAPDEIGIQILKFPEVIFCSKCQEHSFINGCGHPENEKISFSGTFLRELIGNKNEPPFYLIRPEVYYFLLNNSNPLIDAMYCNQREQKGFILWFTGLSQSGKTTTANAVYEILQGRGFKAERLDGDVVRQSLTADLGFSREDREENIRRVGYIAGLFSKKGIIVLASFISPHNSVRRMLRQEIPNFIEVFVNAPLEVCEKRDTKGLYQKARAGLIKNFTGISDVYEKPENPDLELRTDQLSVKECAAKVIDYLNDNQYI